MDRPREKRHRSPPARDYRQRSPYVPRPRSPQSSRPRSPQSSRPRSPQSSRPRSPQSSRPRSPQGSRPRSRHGSRPRSPFLPRPRSPHNPRPQSPVLPSRPRSPHGARPRSPFGSRPRGPPAPHEPRRGAVRTRSPEGPRSSHRPRPLHSPLPGSRLHSPPPGPLSRPYAPRQLPRSSPLRGREQQPPYPEAPNAVDLRHRLTRKHSGGDHRGLSPHSLRDKAFAEESLKITVGNDFYNRRSLERTRLYDALDNVSDDSREDFVDECILPRGFSLASLRSLSDEDQRFSPLNIRNDVDYRRDASCRLFQEHLSNSKISRDGHPRSHTENAAALPKMSIIGNQNQLDGLAEMPAQHDDFMSSCGFGMERSSLRNTQDSFNHFSFNVDSFRKDFPKNDVAGTGYQNLERPTEQDLYVLLSQGILADKRKRCNDLGQRDALLQKQDNSAVEAACQDGSRMLPNRSMINLPGVHEKGFLTVENEEEFLYGNAGYFRDETHQSAKASCIPQDEDGLTQEPSTQAQSNLEHSEFGKIQDLLKTIGLEIGDAEMGKLSVRTRERLYGKNLPPKARDRHSTETHMQDAAKLRNRSYTRSPELDQKCSRSPAWSLRTSTDRLSHSKSDFSVKENDGTQEPPGSPTVQEPPSPAIAQEPCDLSLGQKPPNTSPGQEFPITVLGRPTSYNYAALPSPPTLTPMVLAPHQMINSAPYSSAHMLQSSVNMTSPRATLPPPAFPPCSPVLSPLFVPNVNMPPPALFPQYPMPGYAPYATLPVTQNVGIPTAPTPFRYNVYGSVMPPTKSDLPVSPMTQYTRALPLHSNLKVIQTVDTAKSNVATPAEPKEPASSHLVYVHTKGLSDKSTIPPDKNRVSQKLKVLRGLEKLKSDRIIRGKKLDFLQKKLETLNARHGEILQNKAQQNDFHTNPLLQQAKRIENELLQLCKEAEKADEQQSSLEKVAKILGLNISEKQNPPAEKKDKSVEDKLKVGSSTVKPSTPIEVKTQTQVGNSTSS